MKECSTCIHFNDRGERYGDCLCHPPTFNPEALAYMHPLVHPTDGCDQHSPAKAWWRRFGKFLCELPTEIMNAFLPMGASEPEKKKPVAAKVNEVHVGPTIEDLCGRISVRAASVVQTFYEKRLACKKIDNWNSISLTEIEFVQPEAWAAQQHSNDDVAAQIICWIHNLMMQPAKVQTDSIDDVA